MLSRYIKITPLMKYTDPVDLEVSGFKLFSGDDQVDISTATVRINFNPVAGNVGMVLRSVITEGEALVIPANRTRSTGAIYIDLGENKSFDAFQIGFGSTQAKSLTKLKVEYSDDGITYRRLADVTYNVRLKYRNPWTFSGLSAAKTGFPGFLQRSLHHQYVNRNYDPGNRNENRRTFSEYISDNGLRMFTRRHPEDFYTGSDYFGTQSIIPVTSHLKPGKYYFEASSKSGMQNVVPGSYPRHSGLYMAIHMETKDSGQTTGTWGDWYANPPPGYIWQSPSAYFSFTTKYNGRRSNDANYVGTMAVSGGPVPDNYMGYPGGKIGFQGGFAVDTTTGDIKVVNSPFTPEFQFEDASMRSVFNNAPASEDKRIFFSIMSPGKVDGVNIDLEFNFGQTPFQGPVPTGFDDRIGMRWELEIDPNAPTSTHLELEYEDRSINIRHANNRYGPNDPEFDFINSRGSRDMVIHPALNYYVKGKVSDVDGKFFKRTMEIYTFPQMELMGSCGSSTEDGTYEFLNLSYRDYVVVSSDNQNGKFQSEIIGPLKPVLMDPAK